ncbi:MAG: metal-sensitive transcriptional regulator [Chloroflexi bacterium]|nr:metal-sensitive transcriptional regulator [Chloroflexota bacterium]MBI5080345.1 metal-sensitive transcriptional regulator [Chloroflexota bacterium]MBI5348603.1 metal-sensitive transcriptional regulator [Chloroflexota bacterium]
MKVQSGNVKEDLQKRLRRIEGQVRGVQKMLDEDRDCHEIVQQLAAIRSAVQGASLIFMREYASDCLMNASSDKSSRKELVDDLINLMGKAP